MENENDAKNFLCVRQQNHRRNEKRIKVQNVYKKCNQIGKSWKWENSKSKRGKVIVSTSLGN